MKQVFIGFCFLMVTISVFPQSGNVKAITLEVDNVIVNGGIVYVSVSCSETAYKKRIPDYSFQFEPSGNIIRQEITIPIGDCVINIYQDRNGNRECDSGLFGIPKEPVGITSWDGRGPPGNYNRLKISITNTTQIVMVNLYQL